jgi:AraC family transcriptional regulator
MAARAANNFQDRTSAPLPNEFVGATENLSVNLITDQPGMVEFKGSPRVLVSIHVGPSVDVDCRRGGERHRGTTVHGDVEIIPPSLPGVWELKGKDSALVLAIKLQLLNRVVEEFGGDVRRLEVRNRFQARDAQIEYIGWALKAEMEKGYPCGRVYVDSLATALAAILVQNHSSLARPFQAARASMPVRKLKAVLAFIEDNLDQDLGLSEIAAVAGLSVSHFKAQFRKSVGWSAHQYLIRRRVERAAMLLRNGKLPIGQVALESGFCHQSHLATHTRRVFGLTPQEIRDNSE